jgi:tripartite-type tricarboxylate transporter receptor subunit TctC
MTKLLKPSFVFFLFAASAAVAQDNMPVDAARVPMKLVVPFAAGGPTDVVARILGELFSQRNSRWPVVVENRPGAGTIVATAAVAKAAPVSNTFLIATNSLYINPAIGQKLPYDTLAELAGVSMIATQPVALVANKAFPANTLAELIALAKASAAPLNYTSPGPRGVGHLAGEMLKVRAGIQMTHINYNGSAPALTDVIAGRVPIMFDIWHSARRFVEAGELKVIAGASAERLNGALDVPTIADTFPGYSVYAINAMYGPAGIRAGALAPQLEKFSTEIRAIIASPEFMQKASALGIDARGSTPAELDAFTRSEIARWAEIARAANISVE